MCQQDRESVITDFELIPIPATIKSIISESPDVKTFTLEMNGARDMVAIPGQFVEVSVLGFGEATFAITRLSENKKEFAISVKRMGHLTKILHRAAEGDVIGVRGPYGNGFPVQQWIGKNILVIGGGIGFAPLRPVIDYILSHRENYGQLEVIFGARSPQDILYRDDLERWEAERGISLHITIDAPSEDWNGRVGLIPEVVRDLKLRPDEKVAVICGPPIMIRFTVAALRELAWPDERIFTTLEMRMQCGVGQCGRCNVGEKLVCKDGPVFTVDQIPALLV